jgi:NADPH:quinone reductase-like Zn-dependent oxidoreductase
MAAIVQDKYGAAPEDVLRLEEIDRPTIGEREVLVRVRAASIDRGTWHLMAGLRYAIRLAGFGVRRPKFSNPGRALAGTNEEDLTVLREPIEAEKITPVIDLAFPLGEVPAAIRHLLDGCARGKIVVTIGA